MYVGSFKDSSSSGAIGFMDVTLVSLVTPVMVVFLSVAIDMSAMMLVVAASVMVLLSWLCYLSAVICCLLVRYVLLFSDLLFFGWKFGRFSIVLLVVLFGVRVVCVLEVLKGKASFLETLQSTSNVETA